MASLEQWSGCIRANHWKPGRSFYSLAHFMMQKDGAGILEWRVSPALSESVTLESAKIEYRAKFDNL